MHTLPHRAAIAVLRRKPYWTVLPAVVCLSMLSLYPAADLVWRSLHQTQAISSGQAHFIGLSQYRWILQDPAFWDSLNVTIRFVLTASILELILGLGMALLLNFDGAGAGPLRMLFLLPTFVAPVAVALTWVIVLNGEFGVGLYLLSVVGIGAHPWLAQPTLAFGGLVAADVWQWTPFMMLIILAALRSLPAEPYEAAATDGASAWDAFWHLTLPLIKPVIAVAFLLRALDALKVFGLVLVLTGGGPGASTNVVGLYIFRKAFEENQMEYAAGAAVLLLVLTMAIAMLYMRLVLRERSYQA